MRRCPTCSKRVGDNVMVCPRCGHTIPLLTAQPARLPAVLPAAPEVPQPAYVPGATPARRRSVRLWRYYPVAVGAVAVAIFVAALIFGGHSWSRGIYILWIPVAHLFSRGYRAAKRRGDSQWPSNDQENKL
jgi:uncharacterized membrane protein YvbJ